MCPPKKMHSLQTSFTALLKSLTFKNAKNGQHVLTRTVLTRCITFRFSETMNKTEHMKPFNYTFSRFKINLLSSLLFWLSLSKKTSNYCILKFGKIMSLKPSTRDPSSDHLLLSKMVEDAKKNFYKSCPPWTRVLRPLTRCRYMVINGRGD